MNITIEITKQKTIMKKQLFIASLIFSSLANAQSLTQVNEPAIGASATMYVCDSNFSDFSSTTGTGVTWDFSAITGFSGVPTKVLTVVAPPLGSPYSTSTKSTVIPGFITNYWNSTSTDRTSQGFVFSEATVGDVTVQYGANEEKLMDYPFAVTNTLTDTYSGTLSNTTLTPTGPAACTGSIVSTIDGQGTLILPGAITMLNVLRHKSVETTLATVFSMAVTITRTQYDYYDVNSGLPVFSHITIDGTALVLDPPIHLNLVLSSVQPSTLLGVNENVASEFMVYPNPTQGNVTVKGTFSADASLVVLDQAGRTISTLDSLTNGSTIDLSNVEKGIYLVVITNNGVKTTKSISVN